MSTTTLEYRGYRFAVQVERDEDMREPWKEHDGHGIVSEWTARAKAPGERVLTEDRGSRRYYDVAATMKRAIKEQWGAVHCRVCAAQSGGIGTPEYAKVHEPGFEPDHVFLPESAHQTAARAVEEDFQRLRAWCHDEWEWVYVVVTLLDEDGEETHERESLSGIDGDGEYCDEVARELAEEILARVEVDEPDIQMSEN